MSASFQQRKLYSYVIWQVRYWFLGGEGGFEEGYSWGDGGGLASVLWFGTGGGG